MVKLVLSISDAKSVQNERFGIRTIFCMIHFSLQTVKLCSPEL